MQQKISFLCTRLFVYACKIHIFKFNIYQPHIEDTPELNIILVLLMIMLIFSSNNDAFESSNGGTTALRRPFDTRP